MVSTAIAPLRVEPGRGGARSVALPRDAGDIGVSRAAKIRVAAVATALCLIYALIHIATIVRSRQVWFDETFFASIADSLVRTGELHLDISPLWLPGNVYLYGPVHFLTVGSLFELFGIGIVQNRLPGLLFGFALLGVTLLILRHEKVRNSIALTTCALLALDPTFHQAVHSGRNDSTALCFLLLGFFFLLKGRDAEGRAGIYWCAGSGFVSALGVLTTPRPGYALMPMGLILLARWCRRRNSRAALAAVAWGVAFACLYGIWILYAFGGIGAMLRYYADFAETYTGGSRIRLVHAPLLFMVSVLFVTTLVRAPRRLFSELTVFATLGVVGFYVFVKSASNFGALYAFLMIPFAYLALGGLMSECSRLDIDARAGRLLRYGAFGALFLVNGSAFAARGALELAEWQRRDPTAADGVIREVVPSGARVVGDDQFYFAVKRSGSDFQYIERGGTLSERVAYHRDVFRFDYLITNRRDDSEIVQAYLAAVPMRQVAEIAVPPTNRLAEAVVSIGKAFGLSNSLMSGYDGRIYARSR